MSHDDLLFINQLMSAMVEIYDWADNYEDVDDGIPNDANLVKGMIIRHLGDNMKQLEVQR